MARRVATTRKLKEKRTVGGASASVDKVSARRAELAQATLQTIAELGYARTSLREIANKSNFTHGVLHYYFEDKLDLICCAVRYYKTMCAQRYDDIIASAQSAAELKEGFLVRLGQTLEQDALMQRLWYDLRAQALFEEAFQQDVYEIDRKLEHMIWRVVSRMAELDGKAPSATSVELYAIFDGLFQRYLLRYMAGERTASHDLLGEARQIIDKFFLTPAA